MTIRTSSCSGPFISQGALSVQIQSKCSTLPRYRQSQYIVLVSGGDVIISALIELTSVDPLLSYLYISPPPPPLTDYIRPPGWLTPVRGKKN